MNKKSMCRSHVRSLAATKRNANHIKNSKSNIRTVKSESHLSKLLESTKYNFKTGIDSIKSESHLRNSFEKSSEVSGDGREVIFANNDGTIANEDATVTKDDIAVVKDGMSVLADDVTAAKEGIAVARNDVIDGIKSDSEINKSDGESGLGSSVSVSPDELKVDDDRDQYTSIALSLCGDIRRGKVSSGKLNYHVCIRRVYSSCVFVEYIRRVYSSCVYVCLVALYSPYQYLGVLFTMKVWRVGSVTQVMT